MTVQDQSSTDTAAPVERSTSSGYAGTRYVQLKNFYGWNRGVNESRAPRVSTLSRRTINPTIVKQIL